MKTTKPNYKPLRNEVLIGYIDEPDTTKSGLHLPANRSRGGTHRGKILAIGHKVLECSVGDIVLVPGSSAGVALDDKTYMINEDIILAILPEG